MEEMMLFDMQGNPLGAFEGDPPEGYWVRPMALGTTMQPLEFYDKVGPERINAIFAAAVANNALAYVLFRAFVANTIEVQQSFPALLQLEQFGIIAPGSAIAVWG